MNNTLRTITSLTAALLAFLPVRAPAAAEKFTLRASAEVHSRIIFLSDLLPDHAPESLTAAARVISLGHAPYPGLHRRLLRRQIERALAPYPELRSLVLAPDTVNISRAHRFLLPGDVLNALRQAGLAEEDANDMQDRGMRIPQISIAREPKLDVKSLEHMPAENRTLVRLRIVSESGNAQQTSHFAVTIPKIISIPHSTVTRMQEIPTHSPVKANLTDNQLAVKPPILTWAGKPATAALEQPGLKILKRVYPLRNGALGQIIPVRDPDTRRLLRATVTGEARLRLLPVPVKMLEKNTHRREPEL